MVGLLLDMDGTILERRYDTISQTPWLQDILRLGRPVAICSDQGGPVCRNLAGERSGKSYPLWPGIMDRLATAMALTGVRFAFVSLYHPDVRLPRGELLYRRGMEIGLPEILIRLAYAESDLIGIVAAPNNAGLVFASWNPRWRKPGGGALRLACRWLGRRFQKLLYVGDEENDRYAAIAAGLGFVHVNSLAESSCQQPRSFSRVPSAANAAIRVGT